MKHLAAACLGMALILAGCASIPEAPTFDPLPPGAANLRLRVGAAEGGNNAGKAGGGGTTIEQELLAALGSALKEAGFQLVYDARTADASVNVAVGFHGTSFAPYRTTLILRGPRGTQIDQVQFVGGQGSDYSALARGIASNLVDKLLKSPIFIAYAQEPRSAAAAGETAGASPVPEPIKNFSSDVDEPRYRLAEDAGAFAVVVGVEKYSNDLPAASFAERDAQAVKNHLVALGYPERNIKFLTGSRAVRSALAAYLEDWLPRNVKEDGKVFFYFSGHGAPDPGSGQAYLVPWDGDPNFLDKTAYPLKKLYADLNALKAKKILVALDSCFSGSGGRSVLAKGARPLVSRVDTSVAPGGNMVLFAAASSREITSALEEQGHGIFTYYFLKGLGGDAKDRSGAITAQGLFDYLKPKVQDAASRQNRDQTPVLEGAAEREIIRLR
ncbi:MAG: caspase domain-containing protein [Elusimicrobiota bacterium]